MKKFFWEMEIVSIQDNVVTFKGGEQETFSPIKQRLITDKKKMPEELSNLKLQMFQAIVFEAFDTLDMTDAEFAEWTQLVTKKWNNDKWDQILKLLGVKGFEQITYKTIFK